MQFGRRPLGQPMSALLLLGRRRQGAGVTLVELLTVIVVLAILAAIAVPSYRGQVQRTQRTEATAALLRIGAAQEAHFLQHSRYAGSLADAAPAGLGVAPVTERGLYALTLATTDAAGSGYVARATPQAAGRQRDDSLCQEFSLDHLSLKAARSDAGADTTADCWR
jgi:type IV pilus assembly protein PilE